MKMDKDAILKQKFWILLGVFGLLWLIGLSVLYASAGSPAAAAEADFKKAKDAIGQFTGAKRPKNATFLPPWEKDIAQFDEHKKKVWKVAWDGDQAAGDTADGQKRWEGQKGMYTWPVGAYDLQAELLYPDSAKPDDPKSPMFDVDRRQWFKTEDGYLSQFVKLNDELKGDPDRAQLDKPLGAVEFKGGFMELMKPVNWSTSQRPPDIEECWLAQEDFWVKRELLKTVQAAMEAAAHMNPVDLAKEDIKLPEGAPADAVQQVFRNDSWQVQLVFDKAPKGGKRVSPASTIKNVHASHREQALDSPRNRYGTFFRLTQDGNTVQFLRVTGVKVAWGQAVSFGAGALAETKDGFPLSAGGDPSRPMQLEQVFDPTNTPVVAIDQIEIPKVSHRNANRPLIPANPDRYGKKDAPPADAAKTAAPAAPGAPGAGGTTPMMGQSGSPPSGFGSMAPPGAAGGAGGADKSADKTANGFFDRNRYLFVTDQSRHLPVAMTLTIDQSHLGEILVAVANSRLRFQTTQVEFRRIHGAGSSGGTGPGGDRPMDMPFLPPGGVGSGGTTPPGGPPPGGGSSGGPRFPTASPGGVGSGGTTPPGGSPPGGPRGLTPTPFGPPPGPGTPPPAAADEGNPNQVEVTIYGIASLYERPPQDNKQEK